jgi:Domain of unknown function (DUF5753)
VIFAAALGTSRRHPQAAVRHRLGSRPMMRAQIRHLLEVSQRRNVTIQVIPVDVKVHAVAGDPITLLRFPNSDFPDAVYLEQITGAIYLPRPGDVSHYVKVLSRLGVEALTPAAATAALACGSGWSRLVQDDATPLEEGRGVNGNRGQRGHDGQ